MRNFHGAIVFTDEPTGFYGFLRNAFNLLAKEEMEAVAKQGLVPSVEYPSFGYEGDKYETTVRQFYTAWSNFATEKAFEWKDLYKYTNAPDRRYRRAIEKENKRVREDSLREFNDSVRVLVAFVRKRDPRYIPSKQTEAERQNALRDLAIAQATRSRAANQARLRDQVLPDWVIDREPEEQMVFDEFISEEEHFECVVCGKNFKSEKQYWVHESSKKHQKAVKAIKYCMQKENINFHLEHAEKGYNKNGSEPQTILQSENAISGKENEVSWEIVESEPVFENTTAICHTRTEPELAITELKLSDTHDIEENEQYFDYSEEIKGYLADFPDSKLGDSDTLSAFSKPKKRKAAQKRAKRAKQQSESDLSGSQHTCGTCGSSFSSRTRMFQHISNNKHETPMSELKKGGKEKKKKH